MDRYVNIATGNAVVGTQIGGSPQDTVSAYAWLRDDAGRLWLLMGRAEDDSGQPAYARPERPEHRLRLPAIDGEYGLPQAGHGPLVIL